MSQRTPPSVFRAILCPIDFSANSASALRYAAMLARLSDARLIVLHVTDPLLAAAAATRHAAGAVLLRTEKDLQHFVVATLRFTTPPPPATLLVAAGKPPREIVKAARRHRCDLIVMGYRGAGRASRLLFGSTTEGVVRLATTPVVAVPPPNRRATRRTVGRRHVKRAS